MIRHGLTESQKIDYYHDAAEFIEPCSFSKGAGPLLLAYCIIMLIRSFTHGFLIYLQE
jgi:hypothetical protein